jgi:hypothetical protein
VISFRFHLVSLVAVFLALGVGVLTGTTVINRGVVARLESQTESISGQLESLREELGQLQSEAEVWSALGDEATESLLTGRLTQQEVILVTQDGTSEESLAGVRGALEASGATVAALLSIGPRMALATDAERESLSAIVGAETGEDPAALAAAAAQLLAERLADGPNGTDTLEQLLDEDFLVVQGPRLTETGLRGLGGPDEIFVAVAGGPAQSDLTPASFMVPLVADLVAAGMPVAAAEPARGEEQEPPFVTILRTEANVGPLIATQDNVDHPAGQIGIVLALEDLLQGSPGHYGIKDGTSRALPEIS